MNVSHFSKWHERIAHPSDGQEAVVVSLLTEPVIGDQMKTCVPLLSIVWIW